MRVYEHAWNKEKTKPQQRNRRQSHGETKTEKHNDYEKKYSGWAEQQAGRDGGKTWRTDRPNNRN